MSETHYNPNIPFKTSVNLKQFRKFIIKGKPVADARRFHINFQRGAEFDADTIAFHSAARLNDLGDYKTIVCNHRRERMWGQEERFKIFPFSEQKEFEITIMVYDDMYQVEVNGLEVARFCHRIPIQTVDSLQIDDHVNISLVRMM